MIMNKTDFQREFKKLPVSVRKEVKEYHEKKYKQAIFLDTLERAEEILLWIKEVEEDM